MSDTTPTLKIRLKMPDDHAHLGRDCEVVANSLILEPGYLVLDAKWGRPAHKWVADGQDWGRANLTEREKGILDGVELAFGDDTATARLAAIIRRISR